jgi:hypothetical protein
VIASNDGILLASLKRKLVSIVWLRGRLFFGAVLATLGVFLPSSPGPDPLFALIFLVGVVLMLTS